MLPYFGDAGLIAYVSHIRKSCFLGYNWYCNEELQVVTLDCRNCNKVGISAGCGIGVNELNIYT